MGKVYDPIMCMMVEQKTNDAPSKGHEIVMLTENYLRSIGKNNSTGKYDRVVQGVRSLLSQGYLEGEELKKAVKQEADRLLKKYNANDARTCDASDFNLTYNNFVRSLKQAESMDPKSANQFIRQTMNNSLGQLEKQLREINSEYSSIYSKIKDDSQKALDKAYERYMREGKT